MKKICSLCLMNEADQTGSHIIPHFLIKDVLNKEGKTGRDQEIIYTIRKNNTTVSYWGRSLSPEAIRELKGRDLTQDEIDNNSHLFTDDFMCRHCEKRITTIETYITSTIYPKLRSNQLISKTLLKNGNRVFEIDFPKGLLIRLFVYSIFGDALLLHLMTLK